MTPPRLRTPPASSSSTGWLTDAACRHHHPDLWFDPHPDATTTATATCHHCPALAACETLWRALPADQRRHGVWAGINRTKPQHAGGDS